MQRDWRLNAPPNWPVAPDARIGLDWRPDPAWGPPPPGWQVWCRASRRLPIVVPALTALVVTLAALVVGALLGAAALAPRPSAATTARHQPAGTAAESAVAGQRIVLTSAHLPCARPCSIEMRHPSGTR